MIALQVVIFVGPPLPPKYRPADPALEWRHPVRQETSMRLRSLVRRSSASSMVIWDLPDGLAQRDPVGDRAGHPRLQRRQYRRLARRQAVRLRHESDRPDFRELPEWNSVRR